MVNEKISYEEHKDDVIVFSADSVTSFGIREGLVAGHFCNGTGYNNETVLTVFTDPISVGYGLEYFTDLAKTISATIEKEVYIRIENKNFQVTTTEVVPVEEIPLPVSLRIPGMKGPGNGWMGATRDTLWRYVKRFKNNAFIEIWKKMAVSTKNSEKRTVARKLLTKRNISY